MNNRILSPESVRHWVCTFCIISVHLCFTNNTHCLNHPSTIHVFVWTARSNWDQKTLNSEHLEALHLNYTDTDTIITSNASSVSKVLRNDVMSHVRTMESLNQAGRGLLEVGSGDSPHGVQSRLEQLNESWEFVRCETERRQLELENRLSQVKREKQIHYFVQPAT